jgi:DNA polymerase III gamma/tau subunit
MKLRRLFLSVAVLALMAACGGKATETATETAAEATPAVEAVEETPEAPVAEEAAPAPAVKEEKKADPCEAKVKAFEKFVDELVVAQKNKANGAKELKAFSEMLKQAPEQEAAVKECVENVDFKTRVQNAIMKCKQIRSQK